MVELDALNTVVYTLQYCTVTVSGSNIASIVQTFCLLTGAVS